jgi:hypothetical protein
LPPVFARVVDESEDCRAEALAKADLGSSPCDRASYDSASQSESCFALAKSNKSQLADTNAANYGSGQPLMHYVYILQSEADERRYYTGVDR